MIRIQLPPQTVLALQRAFRQTGDRRLRDRLQIILLAHRHRPHQDIADDRSIPPRTVPRWLNAYLEHGLEGLRSRQAPGATPKLTKDLAPLLRQWVIDGPLACGLDRANWTYAEFADHLYRQRGIRVRKSAMQVFCNKHGIRPYRPTYRFLCGDPDKQAVLYRRTGESKTRRLQRAFADHLRQIAAKYPAQKYPRVVLIIDNAPWHGGEIVQATLAENPHLELQRLPSYSPQLNGIERFWKLLRRRATPNRLFDTVADLKRSIRNSLRYFQTVRSRIQTLIANCYPSPINQTPLTGL